MPLVTALMKNNSSDPVYRVAKQGRRWDGDWLVDIPSTLHPRNLRGWIVMKADVQLGAGL